MTIKKDIQNNFSKKNATNIDETKKKLPSTLIYLPVRWRLFLDPKYRILQWVHPRFVGQRAKAYLESTLDDLKTRSERVFVWVEGSRLLEIIKRPESLLPVEPLPWERAAARIGGEITKQNKLALLHLWRKRSAEEFRTASLQYENGHAVVKYHYVQAAAAEQAKTITNRHSSYDSGVSLASGSETQKLSPVGVSADRTSDPSERPSKTDLPNLADVYLPIIPRRTISTDSVYIGEGAFGSVRLVRVGGSRQAVVKSFDKRFSTTDDILKEAGITAYLSDTGVVPELIGVTYGVDFRVSIVQEFCADGTTLYEVLNTVTLRDDTWINIMRQLAEGLRAIHNKDVLVNDLKDDNILVDVTSGRFGVKYIDFGLATFKSGRVYDIDPEQRHLCFHLAPEIMDGTPTSPASDIFSLGKVLERISFRSAITGLFTPVWACVGPVVTRPSCDALIEMINGLCW